MSEKGYVAIDRQIFDSWVYDLPTPWDEAHAWIDLILLASWSDGEFYYRGNVIKKERGKIYRSMRSLADRWHWSKDKTSHFLRLLESKDMIRIDMTSGRTVITVENYNKFQNRQDSERTSTGQSPDSHRTLTGTYNKENQENHVKKREATPPSIEEVEELAQMRFLQGHPKIDPEMFWNYYEGRHWTIDGSMMADRWKNFFISWEKREQMRKQDKGAEKEVSFMDLV